MIRNGELLVNGPHTLMNKSNGAMMSYLWMDHIR